MSHRKPGYFHICITSLTVLFFLTNNPAPANAEPGPMDHNVEVQWIEMLSRPLHPAANPRPDLQPVTEDGDWQAMIDAVWGEGLPGSEQLALFQGFMTTLDHEFALFRNRDVDLVGLYTPYLDEIQAGVSKGRFQAIMNKMCLALQNGHTIFLDSDVYYTDPEPGVPLLVGMRYGINPLFGACLTTGDNEVFVYDVIEDHPLGLEVGDVILGFEGRPWIELYEELFAAELPIGGSWLTSQASFDYGWDVAVGNNCHLFETIDIQKYDTGQVQHLDIRPMFLPGVDLSIFCSDQLNDDIPRPPYPAWATWGVLETGNSRVGFIWCDAWSGDVEANFGQACLEMVNDPDLDGLIIDFRNNMGGNMFLSNLGLSHLFNQTVATVGFGYRFDPDDHWPMVRYGSSPYNIPGNPADYFDKPIAVLLGPRAISSGDQVAYRMIYHPMVRTFGRPTSATFDSPVEYPTDQYDEFFSRYSKADAGPYNHHQDYLSYLGFPVDEEVWLEPEDSRNGVDTVIQAALDWIGPGMTAVPEGAVRMGSRFTGVSPNPANPRTLIKFQLDQSGPCRLAIYDVAGRLVASRDWASLEAGSHDFVWDGIMASGQGAASGIYMVQLKAPDRVDGARFTLVR